jgi:hypothetical protein
VGADEETGKRVEYCCPSTARVTTLGKRAPAS